MTFLQFWLMHKTSSLLTCDVCSRRGCCWLCPASTNPVLGCSCVGWQGWGCCTFHLQPQLHLRIKGVICWRERYLQTPRRCLNEPLSLPRRCLLSKHSHIYQLLQQPNGHKTSSQHMEGVLNQEQTVTGITCQISRLTIGLGSRTHLFDSCTWLQVRHHSEDAVTQTRLSSNSSLAVSHCWITQFIHKCNDQEHTDLPQPL